MRGHIAVKNGRYYPVISIKDRATGKWKRKWLSGHRTPPIVNLCPISQRLYLVHHVADARLNFSSNDEVQLNTWLKNDWNYPAN